MPRQSRNNRHRKKSIRGNLKEILNGYVEAFPEAKSDFFNGNKMHKVVFVEHQLASF